MPQGVFWCEALRWPTAKTDLWIVSSFSRIFSEKKLFCLIQSLQVLFKVWIQVVKVLFCYFYFLYFHHLLYTWKSSSLLNSGQENTAALKNFSPQSHSVPHLPLLLCLIIPTFVIFHDKLVSTVLMPQEAAVYNFYLNATNEEIALV